MKRLSKQTKRFEKLQNASLKSIQLKQVKGGDDSDDIITEDVIDV
ncbi:MAG: hypothetical protein AAF990_07085 [Bacteroidota bacterium]